jgi:hypothetical protein
MGAPIFNQFYLFLTVERRYLRFTAYKGKVSYEVKSGDKKILKLQKGGKIKVKKGTKKGTYKLVVNIISDGDSEYLSSTKKVTIHVKIK